MSWFSDTIAKLVSTENERRAALRISMKGAWMPSSNLKKMEHIQAPAMPKQPVSKLKRMEHVPVPSLAMPTGTLKRMEHMEVPYMPEPGTPMQAPFDAAFWDRWFSGKFGYETHWPLDVVPHYELVDAYMQAIDEMWERNIAALKDFQKNYPQGTFEALRTIIMTGQANEDILMTSLAMHPSNVEAAVVEFRLKATTKMEDIFEDYERMKVYEAIENGGFERA